MTSSFRGDKVRLVFATEALGMGVDIPDVRRIIHIGPPYSVESKSVLCTLHATIYSTIILYYFLR